MTNAQIMKKYLNANVIQALLSQGFTGNYPHFQRKQSGCIELITFQTNKYGGAFTLEVSAVFPDKENKNLAENKDLNEEPLSVWHTNKRYRLKGMHNGWFYYHDLYAKRIIGFGKDYLLVSERSKKNFVLPKGYKTVQQFSETTAVIICDEVNRQLKKAFRWLERFKKRNQ